MLGRPGIMIQCHDVWAGSWLICSVHMERTMQYVVPTCSRCVETGRRFPGRDLPNLRRYAAAEA